MPKVTQLQNFRNPVSRTLKCKLLTTVATPDLSGGGPSTREAEGKRDREEVLGTLSKGWDQPQGRLVGWGEAFPSNFTLGA